MLDALTFVLFNKPFRKINKSQLINTINEKSCAVEIEFDIGKESYKIIRGIKPNIFEVYKNGKVYDQLSASVDQQKWLEQTILKLNYKSFTQIVILGSSNFVPFMQLSSQNRREVVEDILDIKVFSLMNDGVKLKIKEIKDEVRELIYKKDSVENKIETQKDFIAKLQKNDKDAIDQKKSKIKTCFTEINNAKQLNEELESKIEVLNEKIKSFSGVSTKLKKLVSLKGKLHQKVSSSVDEHKFFTENTVCPTCKQNIDEDFRLNKINDTQLNAKELQKGLRELEEAIQQEEERETEFNSTSKEISSLNHEISKNNIFISQYQKQINDLQSEVQNITNRTEERDVEDQKLKTIQKELEDIIISMATKKEEMLNYEFIASLLKDDGAKSKIIKKYLPVINHNLNKYLDILEFSINFTLDEEFNEKALNPIYDDFSYSSFSEGEKMRIDLALLFTWREIAKLKNSTNTNLLILDEVFDSSLDDFGTDNFTKIIRYIIKQSNVFVISHKTDELLDKFDDVLKFEKRKSFSYMVD